MKSAVIIFSFIFFLAGGKLLAQDNGSRTDTAKSKIDSIEIEITNLKNRISELEKEKVKQRAKTGNYKVRANWLLLEKGMTKEQVKELLGEPGKVLSGFGAYWYYPDSFGGKVEFDDNEKVTGWSEP